MCVWGGGGWLTLVRRTVVAGDRRDIGSERIGGERGPGHQGPPGPISYSPQSSRLIQVSSVRFRPFDQVSAPAAAAAAAAVRRFKRTRARLIAWRGGVRRR